MENATPNLLSRGLPSRSRARSRSRSRLAQLDCCFVTFKLWQMLCVVTLTEQQGRLRQITASIYPYHPVDTCQGAVNFPDGAGGGGGGLYS